MATITLTIPDELLATYQWFQAENGTEWASAFLAEKLKELQRRHDDEDIADARAGRASPQTKARLRAQLGL